MSELAFFVRGHTITCPICQEPLWLCVMSVSSHLKKHVRRGALTSEDAKAMTNKLFRKDKRI